MEEQTNTQETAKKGNSALVAVIGIVVIVVAGYFGYTYMNKPAAQTTVNQTAQPTTAAMQEATTAPEASAGAMKGAYKDGTYTAVGDYTSPGGPEELGVSLTIANGVVKDSKVEVKATKPNSVRFQTMFADNYKTEVVGKSLDELNLGKVSGSSLAPKGFNDAVAKIKAEAKS